MTLKKKIAAVAAAAMMAMSMTAISASAAEKITPDTFLGKEVIYSLYANSPHSYFLQEASTKYEERARVFVTLDVDDYITGKPYVATKREEGVDYISVCSNVHGRLSLFSTHEVISGNKAWGEHQQIIDVDC